MFQFDIDEQNNVYMSALIYLREAIILSQILIIITKRALIQKGNNTIHRLIKKQSMSGQ